ncbi:Uncharacterized protein Adt_05822 [Abeliophyllum distichum]|uniref:Uncharacterized protein n=1 Tax=Abeliophyllum distichum TaxID=126358 RepID=A0ABD1V557_9LAMI
MMKKKMMQEEIHLAKTIEVYTTPLGKTSSKLPHVDSFSQDKSSDCYALLDNMGICERASEQRASEQRINMEKTSMTLSLNMGRETETDMQAIFGMTNSCAHEVYLDIADFVWGRINGPPLLQVKMVYRNGFKGSIDTCFRLADRKY